MKNYNDVPTRNKIVSDACNKCLKLMYKMSYPPSDEIGNYKEHYIPEDVYKMISESFLDAYRISPEVKDTMEIFINFLKAPYKMKVRIGKDTLSRYEDVEPASQEFIDKLSEYIEMFLETHRWNGDENTFLFNVSNYAPSSNKEAVEELLKKNDPNASIPDDSDWDEDYGDDEYFNGVDEEDWDSCETEEDKNI